MCMVHALDSRAENCEASRLQRPCFSTTLIGEVVRYHVQNVQTGIVLFVMCVFLAQLGLFTFEQPRVNTDSI